MPDVFCYFQLDFKFGWGYEKACQLAEATELITIPEAIVPEFSKL
jgi:hypothetical protein